MNSMAPTTEFLVRPYGPNAKALLLEWSTRLAAGESEEEAFVWALLKHAQHLDRIGWATIGTSGAKDFTVNAGMAQLWRDAGLHVSEVFA